MFFVHLLAGMLIAYFLPVGILAAVLGAFFVDIIDKPLGLLGLSSGRGVIFHSWIILIPFGAWLAMRRKSRLALAFFLGTLSHLLIDTLDSPGVPLFYPFSQQNVYLGVFKPYYPLGSLLAGQLPQLPDPPLLAAEALALLASICVGYLIWKRDKEHFLI
jgi:membrane-bound metal-dependent hydrolase YbcI (DUF457 family)